MIFFIFFFVVPSSRFCGVSALQLSGISCQSNSVGGISVISVFLDFLFSCRVWLSVGGALFFISSVQHQLMLPTTHFFFFFFYFCLFSAKRCCCYCWEHKTHHFLCGRGFFQGKTDLTCLEKIANVKKKYINKNCHELRPNHCCASSIGEAEPTFLNRKISDI